MLSAFDMLHLIWCIADMPHMMDVPGHPPHSLAGSGCAIASDLQPSAGETMTKTMTMTTLIEDSSNM